MHKLTSKLKLGFLAIAALLSLSTSAQAQQTLPGTYAIPDSTWEMIVFPGIRGNRTTVANFISSTQELSAANLFPTGNVWTLYKYDPAAQAYVRLGADDFLEPGVGYWILQVTGSEVILTPPADLFIAGLPYETCNDGDLGNDTASKDLCTFSYISGDVEFPDSTTPLWRMMGNASDGDINFRNIIDSVRSSTNGDPYVVANPLDLFFTLQLWRWDSSSNAFLGLHQNQTTGIPSWAAYWFNFSTLPSGPTSYALTQPTGESKTALASANLCPIDCTTGDGETPPPPPLMPEPQSFVEITRDSVNDIQSISHADVSAQRFFTFTAGNRTSEPMCTVSTMSFDGDNANRPTPNVEEKSMTLTDLQYVACLQQEFAGNSAIDISVPVPVLPPQ